MNRKTKLAIIGVIALILVTIAVTYAYWLVTKTQTGENEITAGCLDIAISGEANDIELSNQFPMSDEDGMELVPYEFTVTNNCNTSVDYQVALEATGEEETSIISSALKVALNDSISLLSNKAEVAATIDGAYESRVLGYSRLAATGNEESSATYKLRIWIDADAPISEMNKTFKSKISVTVGQGIESPYAEGTLAYSMLANAGGANAINEIDATWTEGTYGTETYQSMTASTSYYWGTEMNFDSSTGKYILDGTIVQATTAECRNGALSDGTIITCSYTLRSEDSAEYQSSEGYKVISLTSSSKTDTSYSLFITVKKASGATNAFSNVTTANESGLYKTQDDLGDSYYFRGAATNNYVEFGKYAADYIRVRGYYSSTSTSYGEYATIEECNAATSYNYNCTEYKYAEAGAPMYWRIVRINGDGTIRLAYDGTEKAANGTSHMASIGNSVYTNYWDIKHAGYTYDDGTGTHIDNTIKSVVDDWYDAHLETTYGKFLADGIFCNDIEMTNIKDGPKTLYMAGFRAESLNPKLTCSNKSDRYTMSDTINGNGLLTNPVGLITADEIIYAGGSKVNNTNYYLPFGENFWTLSPSVWYDDIDVLAVNSNGKLESFFALLSLHVRPVINLKADVLFEGNGTIDSPYKIVTE